MKTKVILGILLAISMLGIVSAEWIPLKNMNCLGSSSSSIPYGGIDGLTFCGTRASYEFNSGDNTYLNGMVFHIRNDPEKYKALITVKIYKKGNYEMNTIFDYTRRNQMSKLGPLGGPITISPEDYTRSSFSVPFPIEENTDYILEIDSLNNVAGYTQMDFSNLELFSRVWLSNTPSDNMPSVSSSFNCKDTNSLHYGDTRSGSGMDPFKKGVTSMETSDGNSLIYEDTCDENYVLEGYCKKIGDNWFLWRSKLKCEGTCLSGECSLLKPTIPSPQAISNWIDSIIDWIRNLFANIFTFSITGPQTVEPNTQATYTIDLNAQIPDSDWSDGTYSVQYGNWALIGENSNIKQQGTWEKINGQYSKSVTLTTPSNIGDYILVGIITQIDMNYNFDTGQWTTGEEQIINKEAIDLKTKYTVEAPEVPLPGGFQKFINDIINFLKNLFQSIFG